MGRVSRALVRLLHDAKIDIRRWPASDPFYANLARILRHLGVTVVLDVGANVGQYAVALRQAGYLGRIVSFEPAQTARPALIQASSSDSDWIVAPALALGATDGDAIMHNFNRSDMNSMLPMSAAGYATFPKIHQVGTESVPVSRLDDVIDDYTNDEDVVFLKIDTQGLEADVLAGASNSIQGIPIVQVELAYQPLYDHAPAFEEIYDMLRETGHRLVMTTPVYMDKATGLPVELDAVFVKS